MATLRYTTNINGVATDVTSVVLCDPSGTYGVRRNDTGAIVVAANAAFTHTGTGLYSYTFAAVASVPYTAWIKRVYAGKTLYREVVWTATGTTEEITEAEVSPEEVSDLVDAYSATAVFHTDTPSFDPATGAVTRAGAATHTVNVIEENRTYYIPNGADVVLYFSPYRYAFTPETGQLVDYKGQHWTIVSARPTAFQAMTMLWTIALKGIS